MYVRGITTRLLNDYWGYYNQDNVLFSYPLGQKSTNNGSTWTSGYPTRYSSISELANNYYGTGNYIDTNDVPMVYIKTTTESHEVCIYYRSLEFCIGPGYWDTNVSTTLTKMKNSLEAIYGVTMTCTSSSISVNCEGLPGHGSNSYTYCTVDNSGQANCDNIGDDCIRNSNGTAKCYSW